MANLAKLDEVKYKFQKKTILPGNYTIHRPSQCNLKFPKDNRPIHKTLASAYEGKEVVDVPQDGKWRKMLIPSKEPTYYPAILHKTEYERLKEQARVVSLKERLDATKASEDESKKKADESELRKALLKKNQKQQPGSSGDASGGMQETDQSAHTLKRSTGLKNEQYQGPRIANQIILASKCHAIRDAQLLERALIKKDLWEEEKRLDLMMEDDRLLALQKEEQEYAIRKARRLENIRCIKQQIAENDKKKLLDAERTLQESIRLNQAGIAVQMDEVEQIKKRREAGNKLKELLDRCNEELMYFKQLQLEEDRIMNERINNFIKQRHEREARQRAEAQAVKDAKEKGIGTIAKAQKAEKELHEELERIRNLKIQEDVEREFRRKERDNAIKKQKDMKELKESREQQIADIRRQIALEIARDEKIFNNVVRQNQEDVEKENHEKKLHNVAVQKHRQSIIKQINDKERDRIDLRQRLRDEGLALRLEIERQEKLERAIIKGKIADMREQKIPEVYVSEVEQGLAKLKYY